MVSANETERSQFEEALPAFKATEPGDKINKNRTRLQCPLPEMFRQESNETSRKEIENELTDTSSSSCH